MSFSLQLKVTDNEKANILFSKQIGFDRGRKIVYRRGCFIMKS